MTQTREKYEAKRKEIRGKQKAQGRRGRKRTKPRVTLTAACPPRGLPACQGDPEIQLGVSQKLSSQDHSPQSGKLILQQLSCFEY